jgi:hypothetical protein
MEPEQIEALIQASLADTDFNDLDVFILILTKRLTRQKSVSSVSWSGLLRWVVECRNEMDAFRAKQQAMNAASELVNRKQLLESLLA